MGTSHITSNVVAGGQKITVASLNATNLKANTKMTTPIAHATSYVKIGTAQYIFVGAKNTEASIVAEATALVGTPIKGSLYLSTAGQPWYFKTDSTASPIAKIV